jgi:hypothetical protein
MMTRVERLSIEGIAERLPAFELVVHIGRTCVDRRARQNRRCLADSARIPVYLGIMLTAAGA